MNKQILVVDDDCDLLDGMTQLLEMEGYSVTCAGNGQEAIDWLRATPTPPCLILLDLMMPVKNGYEFRCEQQRDPVLAQIPVVVMSADVTAEDKVMQMGTKCFLKKPADIDALLGAAASYCGA